LVIARHFFITGSLAIGLDYNRTDYRSELETKTSEDFSTNTHLRVFAGYNSERSAISFTFTNSAVSLTAKRAYSVSINTGNVRLNYVRRFSGGPKTRKFLNWVDGIFK
jgi:type IV secretory pathway ATPase VirB11/archaellum biosynthesis ATPase